MINQTLHRAPQVLDSQAHATLRARLPVADWNVAAKLNSILLAAVEFPEACRDFPIVFIRAAAEPDGSVPIVPVAVFGLSREENLFIDGSGWRGTYMPAMLRGYPFTMAHIEAETIALVVDTAWEGLSQTEGERLFDDKGEPTELTTALKNQLEQVEVELFRTRGLGYRLNELGLLRDMRFDVTLGTGQTVAVDGFLTVDDSKLKELADDVVLDLHKRGILALAHAHLISLNNIRRLAEWRAQRQAAAAAPAAANDAA